MTAAMESHVINAYSSWTIRLASGLWKCSIAKVIFISRYAIPTAQRSWYRLMMTSAGWVAASRSVVAKTMTSRS